MSSADPEDRKEVAAIVGRIGLVSAESRVSRGGADRHTGGGLGLPPSVVSPLIGLPPPVFRLTTGLVDPYHGQGEDEGCSGQGGSPGARYPLRRRGGSPLAGFAGAAGAV